MMKRMFVVAVVALSLTACGTTATPDASVAPSQSVVTVTAEPTTAEPTTPEPPAEPTIDTDAVAEYLSFATDMSAMLTAFSDAAQNEDYDTAALSLGIVGQMAQTGLDLPSIGIPEIDDEWDAAMNDLKTASEIGVPAINNRDAGTLEIAAQYLSDATDHIVIVGSALQGAS